RLKMDIVGEFHLIENDGKSFLEYHHSKYHPIPQIQSPPSSDNKFINNHFLQSLFLCPKERWRDAFRVRTQHYTFHPIISSPECCYTYHSVHPLFWCNNKEFEKDGGCDICNGVDFGTDYYLCVYCDEKYHRECVQSPLKIKSPYHPQHSLQLYYRRYIPPIIKCLCCERIASGLLYYCDICEVFMHPVCAMRPIPFVIDQPKRHDHPLTFFPRQASLTCNVCGLLRKNYFTYICVKCNFVAHKDCMYFPRIIKISRHRHRISYTTSLQSGEWFCGVCRQSIETSYGAYTCDKCCDYFVHSICALGKDMWDGKDLEGVPEEDDITEDVVPFIMISKGVILHFLHDHHLYLQVSMLYDENKFCQACVLPIFEGDFYSCIECDFILHETCAKYGRKLQHALHPHPLTLKLVSPYESGCYGCDACGRVCGGFNYGCHLKECNFDLDIRCASISEPFDYQGHEHPLVLCGEEVCEKSWCEVCEHDLRDTNVIYWCDECCITVHIDCLFGKDPYLKHGHFYKLYGYKHQTFCKSNTSRPLCNYCRKRCQNKIFMRDNIMLCSVRCNDGFKQHDQPSAPTIGLVMTAQDYTRHKSRLISLGLGLSF
ncbi:hypothetical protein HID58_059016, partial [Brassica napus]